MFQVGAGNDPETVRCHILEIGAKLRDQPAVRPDTVAPSITVTLDSTFIHNCEDGVRHLEIQVGNVETAAGGRQVFGVVANADTDVNALICQSLDAVGRTEDTVLTAFADGCSGRRRRLCRTASGRFAVWHCDHRGDGQFLGEPPDGQIAADALQGHSIQNLRC